jgi:hypothetical protein
MQGYADAMEDYEAATDAMMEAYPDTDRDLEEISIEMLAPLWTEGADQFGEQTVDRWREYAGWMVERGLLAPDTDLEDAFTDEFVAQ